MNEEIEDYLLSFHRADLVHILENDDILQHFSLNINFILLYEHKPDSVVKLLNEPDECLAQWDKAALRAQMSILKDTDKKCQLKNNVHCRIFHLPFWPAVRRTTFPGNRDIGKFFQLSGTVMRVTSQKLLEYQRSYICVKCKTPLEVKAEYDRRYMIKQPKKCDNADCGGTNFVNFGGLDSENCKDYQEIKIQEQVKQLGMGSMPDVMCVTLEDDLVDCCKPGDNVTICGVLRRRWGEFSIGKTIEIDLAFKANHVQVDNSSASMTTSTPEVRLMFDAFWHKYREDPLEGRDVILKSFCTQLYGLYLVKLAMAVVLAGGGVAASVPTSNEAASAASGFRTRHESHLLLVGDPGTGKSQLLRFATRVVPRSVLTTGVGSTAAGLTVTATMEKGEWHLEGGALVMADGGICCIDEFNSMRERDRTCIHEAMEQQTISVAKAGIVTKLNTRCSILAACNPKGNIDPSQSLSMNIALPSPLLSRFDLILMLRDVVNEEWDEKVADYILNKGNNVSKLTDSGLWTVDVLQSYFVTIKKFNPKLTEDAELILGAYYQMQRGIDSRNKARTTVRLLESLVRLSRGHARLMFHENIEVIDSIYAIVLTDTAMDRESAILNLNITTNSVFSERPTSDYKTLLKTVLTRLQLTEILDREVEAIPQIHYGAVQSRFFQANPNADNNHPTCEPEVHRHAESNRFADLSIVDKNPPEPPLETNEPTVSDRPEPGPSRIEPKRDRVGKARQKNANFFDTEICDQDFFSSLDIADGFGPQQEEGAGSSDPGPRSKRPKVNLEERTKDIPVASPSRVESGVGKGVPEVASTKTTAESCVKRKLKRFEFVRRRKSDDADPLPEESRETITSEVAGCSTLTKKKNSGCRDKERRNNSMDIIKDDLEMLKHMPGINDDFGVDLDFDWDKLEDPSDIGTKSDKLPSIQSTGSFESNKRISRTSTMFEDLEDDLDISDLDI